MEPFVNVWMMAYLSPNQSGVGDTMGVRDRPDHGSGGGFGTKTPPAI